MLDKIQITDFAGKEAKRKFMRMGYVPRNVLLIKWSGNKRSWHGMTQEDCKRECNKNCGDSGYCHHKEGIIL